jgi:hypothetical protein
LQTREFDELAEKDLLSHRELHSRETRQIRNFNFNSAGRQLPAST